MLSGHVFIAASLDGFIAREDGDIDWLTKQPTEGEDHGYERFIDSVDGVVMGRNTFRKVLSFDHWPFRKPVVVLSDSLGEADLPSELVGKVTLSNDSPNGLAAHLFHRGWRNAYIDGGRLIQSFLKERLVETMTITHVPILLGRGTPLFSDAGRDIDLTLLSSTHFPSGLVTNRYKVDEFKCD